MAAVLVVLLALAFLVFFTCQVDDSSVVRRERSTLAVSWLRRRRRRWHVEGVSKVLGALVSLLSMRTNQHTPCEARRSITHTRAYSSG